jgi:hypothetical protein
MSPTAHIPVGGAGERPRGHVPTHVRARSHAGHRPVSGAVNARQEDQA